MAPLRFPIAKITRPRLHNAVDRERLFAVIDRARAAPIIWITGPPGAGKTALVSTYLERFDPRGIWYQLESSDADLASFFYFARTAASARLTRRASLPLYTSEYLRDPTGFTKSFIRNYFALAQKSIVVLDNYHEIPMDSPLHEALAAAFDDVPEGSNIVVISREGPPAAFSRSIANERLKQIRWDQLRMTRTETAQLVRSRGISNKVTIKLLFDQTEGWAAGVTLLLEQLRRDGALWPSDPWQLGAATFDYFASQIFNPAHEQARTLLMKAALLPCVTGPLLECLSGIASAGEVLEHLYRQHLFLERRPGNPPIYHLHSLFRDFLLNRVHKEMNSNEIQALRRKGADLLAEAGLPEGAISVLLEIRDWDRLADLLVSVAPQLIAQGRWQTFQAWVSAIPEELLAHKPRIGYWLGRALAPVDPSLARKHFTNAYEQFRVIDDQTWQLHSAVGVLEAVYYEYSDLTQMDDWIARIIPLLEAGVVPPTDDDELRLCCLLTAALLFRDPGHSQLQTWATRASMLIRAPIDVNLRLMAATILHYYSLLSPDDSAANVSLQYGPLLAKSPDATAARVLYYWAMEGYVHYAFGRYPQAFKCFQRADRIAAAPGLGEWIMVVRPWWAMCARRAGQSELANRILARLDQVPQYNVGFKQALYATAKGLVAFDRGEYDVAADWLLSARKTTAQSGQAVHLIIGGMVAAELLVASGRLGAAGTILCEERARLTGSLLDSFLAPVSLIEAWLAHRRGDMQTCGLRLREALNHSNNRKAKFWMRWCNLALAEMVPLALSKNIEAEAARNLAREFQITKRNPYLAEFPWRIRIFTLGEFKILVDGQAPVYSRKFPKKTLALLKLLIAMGGQEVEDAALIDVLWPDNDGDSSQRALAASVRRLRILLNDRDAIAVRGGHLSINTRQCWVDILAFEALLNDGTGDSRNKALDLYAGGFLAREENALWAIPTRERLKARYASAIAEAAEHLAQTGNVEAAASLYSRAINTHDLVESLYMGLMRCYRALHREGDALEVYRRCRRTFSAKLGTAPSFDPMGLPSRNPV